MQMRVNMGARREMSTRSNMGKRSSAANERTATAKRIERMDFPLLLLLKMVFMKSPF